MEDENINEIKIDQTDNITQNTDENAQQAEQAKEEAALRTHPDTAYVSPYYKPEKNQRRTVSILALVLTVIFSLGCGVLGGYAAFRNYKKNRDTDDVILYRSVVRTAEAGETADIPLSVKEVASLTGQSVVQITTEIIKTSIYMRQYVTSGAGSGIIISENGYIVTNNHVIENATGITVTLNDGTRYDAVLTATDEQTDIAVLKIDAEGLVPVLIGDSDLLSAGDGIVIIGNPLGELGGSVSSGIISATDREITVDGRKMVLLQTDAAVNPGNSGGAMFNMYGELVGIVNAKSTGSSIDNLGFAIPVNRATGIIEQLIAYGYVKGRAYMGITMVEINDIYAMMQYRVNQAGVYIVSVEKGSAAEKAGLETGDIIMKIGEYQISTASDVSNALMDFNAHDSGEITVSRQGEVLTMSIVFDEYIPKTEQ